RTGGRAGGGEHRSGPRMGASRPGAEVAAASGPARLAPRGRALLDRGSMRQHDPFEQARRQVHDVQRWARARRRLVVMGAVVGAAVVALASSYYQVEAEEVGIVLRFGRHVETANPGPHFRVPLVDQVYKVPV